jgi:LysW-gamma-L-lysine carboxypeptidase
MNRRLVSQAGPVSETVALGLLHRMLTIPSPSYHESILAQAVVREMRELGFDAYVDETGNAIGQIDRGPGPSVMLLGHLDTVPGNRPVRCIEGALYGRGAVDAKGPLATMICAAAGATDFPGRITVIGVVEEETPGSRGAMAIRNSFTAPDALIVGEPSGWSTVVLGYKGKLDLRFQVRVPAMHPSSPTPKAAERAAEAWTALREALGPDATHATFDRPGPTLVSITGDLTQATLDMCVRTPIGFDTRGLVTHLREKLLPTPGDGTEGEMIVLNAVAAVRVSQRDPVVRALSAGIRAAEGRPRLKIKTATSDMNTLAEAWSVPMATYGPGDSSLDHTDNEHILLSDYFRGIAVLIHALHELNDVGLAVDRPGGSAQRRKREPR